MKDLLSRIGQWTEKMWRSIPIHLRDAIFTALLLGIAAAICFVLRSIDENGSFTLLIFVLAVVIISRFTEGYFWGVFSSLFGVICVNFVFTYPFWAFNFRLTGYPLTFLTMLAVSLIISAMNTKIKSRSGCARRPSARRCARICCARCRTISARRSRASWATPPPFLKTETRSRPSSKESCCATSTRTPSGSSAWWRICSPLPASQASRRPSARNMRRRRRSSRPPVHKFEKRFKSNIRIAVEVPREVVLVPMDATLIQQVLLNLMENAVLHGESTTELRLSVEHIGDEACFTVSDNGLGIPRERLATLFDGSLSGEKGGGFDMKKNMGIGLSVCQTIVKAHGGRITAENRPEGGAQFRFYLPLKEEKRG